MSEKRPINPDSLCHPVGFAHGWLVESAETKTLYLAGQCGHDKEGRIETSGDLVAQTAKALDNIGEVLRASDMTFEDIVQLNFYVRSRNDYDTARRDLGQVWRDRLGRHFPGMAMFEVNALFDPEALIEIQGVAAR